MKSLVDDLLVSCNETIDVVAKCTVINCVKNYNGKKACKMDHCILLVTILLSLFVKFVITLYNIR